MKKASIFFITEQRTAILNGAVVESNLKLLNAPQTNYSPSFQERRTEKNLEHH
jgi:hypothetical protein